MKCENRENERAHQICYSELMQVTLFFNQGLRHLDQKNLKIVVGKPF